VAGLATLAFLCGQSTASPPAIEKTSDTFKAGGRAIKVEHFQPKPAGKYPAIILVHGSDGLEQRGLLYRFAAHTIAREGYVVLLVHYMDRTGHRHIDPKDIKKEHFRAWMDTICEALAYARRQPCVDGERIGLAGFSLGAFLALSVATSKECKIAAVVDWFGGLPQELHKDSKNLPPTLIIHGAKDKVVPVKEAHALEKMVKAGKSPYEIKIYKNQDHLFMSDPFGADLSDAKSRTLAFLEKYVKNNAANRLPSTGKSPVEASKKRSN
jgi:dienelactone hydrolase